MHWVETNESSQFKSVLYLDLEMEAGRSSEGPVFWKSRLVSLQQEFQEHGGCSVEQVEALKVLRINSPH